MAQRGNLTPTGLAFKKKIFIAKIETVVRAARRHTSLGVTMQTQAFVAKQPTEAITSNFMRSMRMAIEYEGILEVITPDDSNDIGTKGIMYIGTAGDVEVTAIGNTDGTSIVLKNVPSGTWLNFIRVKRVWAANTTASDIVLAR